MHTRFRGIEALRDIVRDSRRDQKGHVQTQSDPAVQVGAKLASDSGFHGAIWGSTVEFPGDTGASSEVDYVVGWGGQLAVDWDYPSLRADLDSPELIGTVTWRANSWLMIGYSPDVFATDQTGIDAQLGAKLPIDGALRIEAAIAHYAFDDAYDDSYSHAQLGAVGAFRAPLELRVTAGRFKQTPF